MNLRVSCYDLDKIFSAIKVITIQYLSNVKKDPENLNFNPFSNIKKNINLNEKELQKITSYLEELKKLKYWIELF